MQTTYSDGSSETFTYTADGQLATATNGEGTTTYTYDAMGRLATETKPDGSTLSYGYDAAGNRTSVTATQNGTSTTTSYTYDALNRLASVTDANGTTTYSYDAVGNQSAVVYPNAFSQRYQYNTVNRLTTLEHVNNGTVTERFSYTLDPAGKRTRLDELNGRSTAWGYDVLNRLTSESISRNNSVEHAESYTLDAVGNRTAVTTNGVTTSYTYNANDQVLTAGNVAYSYDNNGNRLGEVDALTGDFKTYQYNAKNRLVAANTLSDTLGFQYDISGIRTAKTVNGQTTTYLVDHNRDYSQVLLEETAGVKILYTYGNDLVNQQAANDSRYYLYDGLGSTRALADETGAITDSYEYSAYGTELSQNGATANAYRYTGEQLDEETGLYYLRARYLDPVTGFTQLDTYQGSNFDPASLHKYLYTHADPINGIDPSGHMNLTELMTAVNNSAINLAVRVSVWGFNNPKLAGAAGFVLNMLLPVEMAAGRSQVGFTLAGSGGQVSKASLRQMQSIARYFEKNGAFYAKLGDDFEDIVAKTLNITKNKTPYNVKLPTGQSGKVVPDFFWGNVILELKTSGGAVKPEQAKRLYTLAQQGGYDLVYLFFKKPTPEKQEALNKAIRAIGGDPSLVKINYIFP